MALFGSQLKNLRKLTEGVSRLRVTASPLQAIGLTANWIPCASIATKGGVTYDPKPKRPLNGCFLFLKENAKPGEPRKVEVKRLAEKWRQLGSNEKRVFEDQSKKALEEYKKKLASWEKSLSSAQKSKYDEDVKQRLFRRAKTRSNMKAKELNRPERPAFSGYSYYLQDTFKKTKGTTTEAFREISGKWKALNDVQRKVYSDRAAKQKEHYLQEMQKWEAEMEAAGNGALLRTLKRRSATSGAKVVSTKIKKRVMKKVPATKKMLKKKAVTKSTIKKPAKTAAAKTAAARKTTAKKTAKTTPAKKVVKKA